MNEIILNVSSRDNLEILLMIEISSRDLLNHPSSPVCPASFLQSYFSRQRSTSSPPRSSQAHSQSSSRLERYREMRRMRDASKNNLKWKEKWKKILVNEKNMFKNLPHSGALCACRGTRRDQRVAFWATWGAKKVSLERSYLCRSLIPGRRSLLNSRPLFPFCLKQFS